MVKKESQPDTASTEKDTEVSEAEKPLHELIGEDWLPQPLPEKIATNILEEHMRGKPLQALVDETWLPEPLSEEDSVKAVNFPLGTIKI